MISLNHLLSSAAGLPAAGFWTRHLGAPLSYAEKHLIAGETVQYETRLHWIVMLGHGLIAAVFSFIAITFLVASPSSGKGTGVAPARGIMIWAALLCFVLGLIFVFHWSPQAQRYGDGRHQ